MPGGTAASAPHAARVSSARAWRSQRSRGQGDAASAAGDTAASAPLATRASSARAKRGPRKRGRSDAISASCAGTAPRAVSAPSACAPAAVHGREQSELAVPTEPEPGEPSQHELERGECETAKLNATRAIAQSPVECIAKDVAILTAYITDAQDESPRELFEEAGDQEPGGRRCAAARGHHRTLSSAWLPRCGTGAAVESDDTLPPAALSTPAEPKPGEFSEHTAHHARAQGGRRRLYHQARVRYRCRPFGARAARRLRHRRTRHRAAGIQAGGVRPRCHPPGTRTCLRLLARAVPDRARLGRAPSPPSTSWSRVRSPRSWSPSWGSPRSASWRQGSASPSTSRGSPRRALTLTAVSA